MIQAKALKKTFFILLILGWMINCLFVGMGDMMGGFDNGWQYLRSISYISTITITLSGLGLIILSIRFLMTKRATKNVQRYVILLYSIRIIGVIFDGLLWSYGDGQLRMTYQTIIVLGVRLIIMLAILGGLLWSQAPTRVVINRQLIIKIIGYILFLIICIIAINTGVSLATGGGIHDDLTIDFFSKEIVFWYPADSLIGKFIVGLLAVMHL
ncbi:hypothetical protein ACVQ8P_08440 [Dellaglioa sp. BT-FLS60]